MATNTTLALQGLRHMPVQMPAPRQGGGLGDLLNNFVEGQERAEDKAWVREQRGWKREDRQAKKDERQSLMSSLFVSFNARDPEAVRGYLSQNAPDELAEYDSIGHENYVKRNHAELEMYTALGVIKPPASAEAPKTQMIKLGNGMELPAQWDGKSGRWVPMQFSTAEGGQYATQPIAPDVRSAQAQAQRAEEAHLRGGGTRALTGAIQGLRADNMKLKNDQLQFQIDQARRNANSEADRLRIQVLEGQQRLLESQARAAAERERLTLQNDQLRGNIAREEAAAAAAASKAEREATDRGVRSDQLLGRWEAKTENALREIAEAEEILQQNRSASGAIGQVTSFVGGTPSHTLDNIYSTLNSLLTTQTMEELKSQSRTGATGYGATNDREIDLMQSGVRKLDSAADKDRQLDNLRAVREHLVNNIRMLRSNQSRQAETDPAIRAPSGRQSSGVIKWDDL